MSGLLSEGLGKHLSLLFLIFLFLSGFSTWVQAESNSNAQIISLQHQWAHIKYQLPGAQREVAYTRLHIQARRARMADPSNVNLWIWEAIILANEAGAKHSLASIQMIKEAKRLLEKAISIRPNAEMSLAYAFLGNLYHSMPGWPLGFGDDIKAEYYLRKALSIAPNGLDENYFMGIYLIDRKHRIEAIPYFRRIIDMPPRLGMKIADAGRKADATKLLHHLMETIRH